MSGEAPVQFAEETFWQKYKWWILVPVIIIISIVVTISIISAIKGSGNSVITHVTTKDGTSTCTKTVNGVTSPCDSQ